jgi:hypothetical protein
MFCYISTIGPTRCTICFQFITINSLYMFRAFTSFPFLPLCFKSKYPRQLSVCRHIQSNFPLQVVIQFDTRTKPNCWQCSLLLACLKLRSVGSKISCKCGDSCKVVRIHRYLNFWAKIGNLVFTQRFLRLTYYRCSYCVGVCMLMWGCVCMLMCGCVC